MLLIAHIRTRTGAGIIERETMSKRDWTIPISAGERCDFCNSDAPTPHAICEADRARAAGRLGKPPLDIEGRHGRGKAIGRFAGFGAMIDPYRISRIAMPTMDGMRRTGI